MLGGIIGSIVVLFNYKGDSGFNSLCKTYYFTMASASCVDLFS